MSKDKLTEVSGYENNQGGGVYSPEGYQPVLKDRDYASSAGHQPTKGHQPSKKLAPKIDNVKAEPKNPPKKR
ncbi:hypothetical protein OC926_22775 [Pseudomonas peradeniyensis]|uniref:hypothetical protein n=1 Tax=Pseudomonas peradeniyensis TaxID=2745488 RepID=UPI0021D48DA6|nr:hypothetical protein [Pseudomonas peradeniyensis]MCU7282678.1 hypothetical protein [Pseudomonas peradeniyensis]